MSSILYLDIFSGISGDMFLGAALDLGVNAQALEAELRKLDLDGWHFHIARKTKSGIAGFKVDVHDAHCHDDHAHKHEDEHAHSHSHDHSHDEHDHGHSHQHEEGHSHKHDEHAHDHDHEHARSFSDIRALITKSTLSDWVKQKSIAVFRRIAVAEGKIHGHPPEQVHFHEVGAVDSIIDVVGACVALELLGKPKVLAAPVVEGHGFVRCAHGQFPIPAPATLEILGARGVVISQCEEPHELVTPTGAALLAEFAESFAPLTGLHPIRIGYGLGTRDNKTRPNVLRVVLAEADTAPGSTLDWEKDVIAILETNLDDINAEVLGHFVESALAAGALDVFHTPIQMKKNRPGVLLTVLCPVEAADQFTEMLLRETTAFGVRRTTAERRKLKRQIVTVVTPHGKVEMKIGRLGGKVVQAAPEYESCKRLAAKTGLPVKAIYDAALRSNPFNE